MGKAFDIINDAIDGAVRYGYNRAHKYTDTPDEDTIVQTISAAVMSVVFETVDGLSAQLVEDRRLRVLSGNEVV